MLQELFNVLDLPGSSVRDVLAGENPFDQWTSPLSDDHRTSGAKLVNRWTGANENSWGGLIGGMGAEMLLDPMNLLPGFGVMKRALTAKRIGGLNRGIRAANEAQQALDAGRYGFVNANRVGMSSGLGEGIASQLDNLMATSGGEARGVVNIQDQGPFKRLYVRNGRQDLWSDNGPVKLGDAVTVANVEAMEPGKGAYRALHDQLTQYGKPIVVEGVHAPDFGPKLEHMGYRKVNDTTYMFEPQPAAQKLLGYDPGVTENYQSISHGTSNPFAGSDDFPAGKLDLRYMGTGEGNQAFGWGSYSAQDPKVSATYKEYGGDAGDFESNWSPSPLGKALMRRVTRLTKDPQVLEQIEKYAEQTVPWHARDKFVQRIVAGAASDPVTAQDWLLRFAGGIPPALNPARRGTREGFQSASPPVADLWRFREPASEVPTGPFHMQMNLPKEAEDRMIRGDVPLAGQPPLVQQALQEVQQDVSPLSIEKVVGTDLIKKSLERVYRQGGLQDPIHVASNLDEREIPQKVAEYLQSKGIVGNKFLDHKSRDKFAEASKPMKGKVDIVYDTWSSGPGRKVHQRTRAIGDVEKAVEDAIKWAGEDRGLSEAEILSEARRFMEDKLKEAKREYNLYGNEIKEYEGFDKNVWKDLINAWQGGIERLDSGKVTVRRPPPPKLEDYTSNYAIWDQPTLDKTRIRKVNGVNIPLANMLKGGRARPTEAALDLVQSTQPMGSPLMQELPVPSLLSRKEALAMGIYNVAARGGFTVE